MPISIKISLKSDTRVVSVLAALLLPYTITPLGRGCSLEGLVSPTEVIKGELDCLKTRYLYIVRDSASRKII